MDVLDTTEFFGEDSQVPPFYRLNSEVKEKPSTFEDGRADLHLMNSSTPSPSSSSQASFHSNSVNGVDSWWMPTLQNGLEFPVSQGDELLALSLCVAGGLSDSELEAQGDVDEGFDEEFEEKDLTESDSNNRQLQTYAMQDLDPKEVQQLLGEEQLLQLEDFDLGVDILDREAQPIVAPVSVASSPMSEACSPDQVLSRSPTPGLDVHSHALQRNRWNLSNDCHLPSSPVASSPLASSPGSASEDGMGFGDNITDYSPDQLAMLVSACTTDRNQTNYDHIPLMDLSETIALASANPLMASEPTNLDLQSMQQFIHGHLPSLLPSTNTDFSSTSDIPHLTSQVLMDSSHIFSNLNFSNLSNDITSDASQYRHPPPPSSPVSMSSTTTHTSTPPSPSPSVEHDDFSIEERRIIDMPWYQFRKVLDDATVCDPKKEDMKNIRRKGKNKAAAKVCRQKKLRNIKGLEHEVQELKKMKQNMAFKSRSLEREIAQLKKKYQQGR